MPQNAKIDQNVPPQKLAKPSIDQWLTHFFGARNKKKTILKLYSCIPVRPSSAAATYGVVGPRSTRITGERPPACVPLIT